MLYTRQKFLITFLSTFGGELSRTNCQKLIFLFCKYYNRNYYDFFPYKFGPFSYILFDDKRALIKKNRLKDVNGFVLNSNQSDIVNKFDFTEKTLLLQFKKKLNGFRGKRLIEKTYAEFPYYAKNSEIRTDVNDLKNSTYEIGPKLFSLGYEGLTIDKYLDKLIQNEIEILFDVRNNPISRKYGFSKTKLQQFTRAINIQYIHIPELGIPSEIRKDETLSNDIRKLFDFYKTDILQSSLDKVEVIKEKLINNHLIALTCFEADNKLCHRQYICDAITEAIGVEANHL